MTLLAKIETHRTQARKDGNSPLATFLGYLISEARKVGKDADNRDSTDEEVIGVIRKQIERNDENLRLTNGDDRNAGWQNKVMQGYLPFQIPDDDLHPLIAEIIAHSGFPKSPKLIGVVMAKLKSDYPGQYNPSVASQIAKTLLQ